MKNLPAWMLSFSLAAACSGDGAPSRDGGMDARADVPRDGTADRPDVPLNVRCGPAYGTTICQGTYLPSALGATDVMLPGGGVGTHFYCFPVGVSFNDKLLLFLVGTDDNPAVTNEFPRRACALGFASVAVAYPNLNDSRSTCANNTNCYELMRREIVYGVDVAPDPIRVDLANSVLGRLSALLDRLVATETFFPPWTEIRRRVVMERNFSTVVLAGHSQGSGHALMLARDFAAERLVMLAGVTDRLNSGMPSHAPVAWIANWRSGTPRTASTRFLGFNHEDDPVGVYAQIDANYDALGVPAQRCNFAAGGTYPATCRRVHVPRAGCGGAAPHTVPVRGTFGGPTGACQLDGPTFSNAPTWAFLLTTPTS